MFEPQGSSSERTYPRWKMMKNKGRLVSSQTKTSIHVMLMSVEALKRCSDERLEAALGQNDASALQTSGGYNLVMTIIAAQAAELALKFAFELEHPGEVAPRTHDLYDLFLRLSTERRESVQEEYHANVKSHGKMVPMDRRDLESLFLEDADALSWRYQAEGKESGIFLSYPLLLVEGTLSVLSTIDWPPDKPVTSDTLRSYVRSVGLALQSFLRDEFQDAVAHYTDAIELRPEFAATYYQRGKAYSGLGLSEQAIQDFRYARDLAKKTNDHSLRKMADRRIRVQRKGSN